MLDIHSHVKGKEVIMLMHHMHQYHIKTTYISNLEMLKTVNETFKGSIAKNLIKISSLKQLKAFF